MEEHLEHGGTPRHSGRYPWGSGSKPQRSKDFTARVRDLQKQGISDKDIAESVGARSIDDLRIKISIASAAARKGDVARAIMLKQKGVSTSEAARQMDIPFNTYKSLLNPSTKARNEVTVNVANQLKAEVAKLKYIDVGPGTASHLGVNDTKLHTALGLLKEQGYMVIPILTKTSGTLSSKIMTLAPPGTKYKDLVVDPSVIKLPSFVHSPDGGKTYEPVPLPKSISLDRVAVKYNEEGGVKRDGIIDVRRNVPDLSLGQNNYAQVRILVGGTHYLKGMAMYSDDMPPGADLQFNTNKRPNGSKLKAMKEISEDPEDPFGTTVTVPMYFDKHGKVQQSGLNMVREEGQWEEWNKSISSQVLSKQSEPLARKQLDLSYALKKEEFDLDMSLTNPVVKKRLLKSFADDCDSASVHLKAAALPRQGYHVLLSFPDMKDTEVYAEKFRDGEKVVLIRYPHGGTFEIPELTVNNNKNSPAGKLIRTSKDAVGVNDKVAARLSGADFDGDTVLVIPNNKHTITTTAALKGLVDFDPKTAYPELPQSKKAHEILDEATKKRPPATPGVKLSKKEKDEANEAFLKTVHPEIAKALNVPLKNVKAILNLRMTEIQKGAEMGKITNLVTDMTIKGANSDEICRAVKHTMVVIDAPKHGLDYRKSALDNRITDLKTIYQGGSNKGAATLISRAKSTEYVNTRAVRKPDAEGKKVYEYTNKFYIDKKGKTVYSKIVSTKMAEREDAMELSSGTKMEKVYGDYANSLKALANKARKAINETPGMEYSPSANKTYKKEVAELNVNLLLAQKNAPLERNAHVIGNAKMQIKKDANPNLDDDDIKRLTNIELVKARAVTGAKKHPVEITSQQWNAIQAGAVTSNTMTKILDNTNLTLIKQYATPRTAKADLSSSTVARARAMGTSGFTQAEIADHLGISTSTLSKALKTAP